MCVNKIVIELIFLNLHFQWVVIFQTDFSYQICTLLKFLEIGIIPLPYLLWHIWLLIVITIFVSLVGHSGGCGRLVVNGQLWHPLEALTGMVTTTWLLAHRTQPRPGLATFLFLLFALCQISIIDLPGRRVIRFPSVPLATPSSPSWALEIYQIHLDKS